MKFGDNQARGQRLPMYNNMWNVIYTYILTRPHVSWRRALTVRLYEKRRVTVIRNTFNLAVASETRSVAKCPTLEYTAQCVPRFTNNFLCASVLH